MLKVYIITAMLAGGVQHYTVDGVYSSKDKCEQVVAAIKLLNPSDYTVQHTVCREADVRR